MYASGQRFVFLTTTRSSSSKGICEGLRVAPPSAPAAPAPPSAAPAPAPNALPPTGMWPPAPAPAPPKPRGSPIPRLKLSPPRNAARSPSSGMGRWNCPPFPVAPPPAGATAGACSAPVRSTGTSGKAIPPMLPTGTGSGTGMVCMAPPMSTSNDSPGEIAPGMVPMSPPTCASDDCRAAPPPTPAGLLGVCWPPPSPTSIARPLRWARSALGLPQSPSLSPPLRVFVLSRERVQVAAPRARGPAVSSPLAQPPAFRRAGFA
mmetsp:Transcript_5297/g.20874  ORF Transcript_5297/g.20874 Transcript_5297/m.20874 type:complete len:262 (+) Transcript_5297:1040-1825(+)